MAVSIQLIALLLFLFILNLILIFRRKWNSVFILIFVLLMFVSPDMVGLISGYPYSAAGKLNISIVGYDVLIVWLCILIRGKGKIRGINKKLFGITIGGLMFMVTLRVIVDGTDVLSNKILDAYLLPILFALLLVGYMPRDAFQPIAKTLLFCAVINAFVSFCDMLVGKSLFFHEYYLQTVSWYKQIFGATSWGIRMRGTAFLGHPLVNGMYYTVTSACLYQQRFKKKLLNVLCFVLLTLGVLSTNSRGAILIFIGYFGFTILRSKQYTKISIAFMAFALAIAFIDWPKLYSVLFARDSSGASLLYRFEAIKAFAHIPIEKMLFGVGYNNTSNVLNAVGMIGNLENAYLILILENGLVGFAVWILILTNMYNKHMCERLESSAPKSLINGALLCLFCLGMTGNYFGDPGTLNYLLWALIAMSRVVDLHGINGSRKQILSNA